MSKSFPKSTTASSNWLALQKKLDNNSTKKKPAQSDRKRQKFNHPAKELKYASTSTSVAVESSSEADLAQDVRNGESLSRLKSMVFGEMDYSPELKQPGKYIAVDCEMVGVGIDGSESSLARVTLVNYYGAVQMDEFVRQRERVVDYRTQYSGIRESDMKNAKSFDEIQKRVAELLQDRILIGHAVHNDLKALLLSHPWNLTRDTQYLARKSQLVRSKYIALRKLVEQELGIVIQAGEHSSLVDSRATMAVYRLHRKEWDKVIPNILKTSTLDKTSKSKTRHNARESINDEQEMNDEDDHIVEGKGKRKRIVGDEDLEDLNDNGEVTIQPSKSQHKSKLLNGKKRTKSQPGEFPGGGRRGVSSGLSTIIRKGGGTSDSGHQKTQWWKELGSGSKGSLRV